jgi:hypothetical protein
MERDLRFRNAVAALDRGDLDGLGALLRANTFLRDYQARLGEWYDQGYFKGASLLHHVAGNPIRAPLPSNVLNVADLLLNHGADPKHSGHADLAALLRSCTGAS